MGEGGQRTEVQVDRWLVQLGFGEPCSMAKVGGAIVVESVMVPMAAKSSTKQ